MKRIHLHSSNIRIIGISILVIAITVFCLSEWIWPQIWGSTPLGNNMFIMDWEEGPILVYCAKPNGRTARAGVLVVPPDSMCHSVLVKSIRKQGDLIISEGLNRCTGDSVFFLVKNQRMLHSYEQIDSLRNEIRIFNTRQQLNEFIEKKE